MRNHWLTAAALLAAATTASASGYAFYEQDAEATGQAGAVIARADNASANFYNPAGLATQDASSFSFGGTITVYGAKGTLDKDLFLVDRSTGTTVVYKAYRAGTSYEMGNRSFFPAHMELNWKFRKNMAFGFYAGAPFALGTKWGNGNNPFKYMSGNTDLRILNYSPSFAMSHWDGKLAWSVGVDYYSGSATLDQTFDLRQKSVWSGSPGVPAIAFPGGDNYVHVDATGHKLGAHLGLQWRPNDHWRLGLVYRTKARLTLDGNADYTTVAGNVGGAIVIPGQSVASLFPDQSASTELPVPASGGVGVAWLGRKWEAEVDATYQGWSAFDNLTLDFSNTPTLRIGIAPGQVTVLTDRRIRENWDDTWAARLGAKWKGWDGGYLAFGGVYDQNPVPASTLRSLLPDGDRTGLTAGVGTSYQHLKFDFSVMWLRFQKRTSDPQTAVNNDPNSAAFNTDLDCNASLPGVQTCTEHETQETLKASYRAHAWLFGLNIGYRF